MSVGTSNFLRSSKVRLGRIPGCSKLTREEELDCDRLALLIAPWLDGAIGEPRLLELLEHHRRLCAECDEEVRLVKAASGHGD